MRPEIALPTLSVAERHNNPLNMKLGVGTRKWVDAGDAEIGEPARDGGNFLRFSSPDKGFEAAQDLLFNGFYRRLDLNTAMRTWSGGGYGAEVAPRISGNPMLQDLDEGQKKDLVQAMALREGYGKVSAPPVDTSGPKPKVVPPFNDLARNLDPMMPQQDYDMLREKYFRDHIMPYQHPASVAGAWNDFKRGTERPSLLGPLGKTGLKINLGLAALDKSALAPLSWYPGLDDVYAKILEGEEKLQGIARREGVSAAGPELVGGLAGMGIPLGGALKMAEPLSAAIAAKAFTSARTIELANRALRGGLAFAAYEAGADKEGDRLTAGLRGFAVGTAWDLALGLPAFLRNRGAVATLEEGKKAAQDVMDGKPVSEAVNRAGAEYVSNQEVLSRQEGRPNLFLDPNAKKKGVWAILESKDGNTLPFEVLRGKEDIAYNAITRALDQGGALDTLAWDADNHGRAVKFLRGLADQHGVKYDESLLLREQTGKAPDAIVDTLKKQGIAAEPKGDVASVPVTNIDVGARSLPEGVRYKAPQMVEGRKAFDIYDVDVAPGKTTTMSLREGEDLNAKLAAVRQKWQKLGEAQAGAEARTIAEGRIEAGEMPKMSKVQAANIIRGFGGDPEKADLEAVMYMGEEELNRLYDVVQKQRTAQVGPEASVVEERGRLEGDLPQARRPFVRDVTAEPPEERRISYHGTSPVNAEKILQEGLVDKFKGYTKEDLIDLGHPREDFEGIPPGRQPYVFTTQTLGDATTYAGPESAGVEEAPRVVFKFEHGVPLSEMSGELIHKELPASAIKEMYVDKGFTGEGLVQAAEKKGVRVNRVDMNEIIRQNPNFGGLGTSPEFQARGEIGLPITKRDDIETLKALGFSPDEYQLRTAYTEAAAGLQFKQKPGKLTVVIPNALFDLLAPFLEGGANGVAWPRWQQGIQMLNLDLDRTNLAKLNLPNSPLVVLREGVGKGTVFHEGYHANLVNAEINPMTAIPREMRGVMTEIASGLAKVGYAHMPFKMRVNEAITYLSEAVRFNNIPLLQELVKMDRTIDHLYQALNGVSKNLLEATEEKLGNPGVANFRRKLNDLINRTDDAMFHRIKYSPMNMGLDFDPRSGEWAVMDNEGVAKFPDLNSMWDHIIATDVSDYTSDPGWWAQARGVRTGPIPPGGTPPGKTLPLPDRPLTKEGFGVLAISGWIRPFMSWVASVDRRLQPTLERMGARYPLFDAVRKVDDGVKAGQGYLDKFTTKFGDQLALLSHEKQPTAFELLSKDPQDWDKAVTKLRLKPEEVGAARKIEEVAKEFQQDTGIPIMTYLREFYPRLKANVWQVDSVPGWGVLKNPRSMGFWEKLLTTTDFDPSDNHLGRFLQRMIREGWEKSYVGGPLEDLQKLVDLKSREGGYVLGAVRWPLQNYVRYMRGIPDASQQAINSVMGSFQNALSAKFKQMNKYLPEGGKLPESFSSPQNVMGKLMLLSYAGGIALRPAIVARDMLQVFVSGSPVIGYDSLFRGLAKGLTREGWDFADRAGALLKKTDIQKFYGDVFNEIPLSERGKMATAMKWTQKLLGPSRWGNNIGRAGVFNGVFSDASEAIEKFKAGTIDQRQFLKDSHLWFTDRQVYSNFLGRALKEETGNVAKDIALELVDATQWAYRKGTQPAVLRTGLGRIMGQYGNWPLNYADYITRMGKKFAEFPEMARGSAARWVATNAAAYAGMSAIGADSGRWLFTSPAAYTGGPQLDLARDLMQSIETTDQGKEARARILRYPLNFIPGNVAIRNMLTAMEGEEDLSLGGEGFMRVMGFKLPKKESITQQNRDWTEWALEESGITANPYRR